MIAASESGFMVFAITVALILVSLQIYRFFGPDAPVCLYCGTRNGAHGRDCPERR